ncbi:hypothetical protein ABFY09_10265 [Marinomonas sp. 5E14-1]|uniref:hypothetical protein n=1 Tax=Marinomonas sp. 5E14-1 TaxID=3153922 RepID=UPI003266DDFD
MKSIFSNLLIPVMTVATFALFSVHSMAANQPPPGEPPSFQELDKNSDNLLTKDELRGPLLDDFDRFDADGSGSLSEGEMPEPPQHR